MEKIKIKKLNLKTRKTEKLQVKKRCKTSWKLKEKRKRWLFVGMIVLTLVLCLSLLPFVPRMFLEYYIVITVVVFFIEVGFCISSFGKSRSDETFEVIGGVIIGLSCIVLVMVIGGIFG